MKQALKLCTLLILFYLISSPVHASTVKIDNDGNLKDKGDGLWVDIKGIFDLPPKEINFFDLPPSKKISSKYSIMHAGGSVKGIEMTNSIDAIESNYLSGKRMFEIDFSKTSDGKYVGLHDWDGHILRFFEIEQGWKFAQLNHSHFMGLKSLNNIRFFDLDILLDFLKEKKDIIIISDIKKDNIEFLKTLKESFKEFDRYFIPQVYNQEEYFVAKELGFSRIIYTLYLSKDDALQVKEFAQKHRPFAITMPFERLKYKDWKDILELETDVFVHTVNSYEDALSYIEMGVDGIYTDVL